MRSVRLAAVVVLAASACSAPRASSSRPEAKLTVVDIELGRAVGADKRVTAPSQAFAPGDVIYTSVVTDGSTSSATLSARWTYRGALLEETAQRIAPHGTAVSEFHVFNPSGWAPGEYRVEILLDGRVVGDRGFTVEAAS